MNKAVSKTLLVFIPITILCTVVRYVQLATVIDFNTGFYDTSSGFLSSLLYILLGLGFVLLVLAALFDRKSKSEFYIKKLGQVSEPDVKILGLMFLIAAAAGIYTIFTGGLKLPQMLALVISVIAYALIGWVLFMKRRISAVSGYLMLLLGISNTIKLVMIFMDNLVITRMSEHLILLLTYVLMALFYFAYGRVFSRNDGRFGRAKAEVLGYSALGLIFCETVSKIIFWLTSSDTMREYLASEGTVFIKPDMLAAAEGIVIFTLLYVLFKHPEGSKDEA